MGDLVVIGVHHPGHDPLGVHVEPANRIGTGEGHIGIGHYAMGGVRDRDHRGARDGREGIAAKVAAGPYRRDVGQRAADQHIDPAVSAEGHVLHIVERAPYLDAAAAPCDLETGAGGDGALGPAAHGLDHATDRAHLVAIDPAPLLRQRRRELGEAGRQGDGLEDAGHGLGGPERPVAEGVGGFRVDGVERGLVGGGIHLGYGCVLGIEQYVLGQRLGRIHIRRIKHVGDRE